MTSLQEILLVLTVDANDAIRRAIDPSQEQGPPFYYGPNPKLIDLPSGPVHVEVSLPPSSQAPQPNGPGQPPYPSTSIPTILFVHGIACNGTLWNPLISAASLRDRFRVVTLDLPGSGNSPAIEVDVEGRLERLAVVLHEVLEYVGAEQTFIVAHSFGAVSASLDMHISPIVAINQTTLNPSELSQTSGVFEHGLAAWRQINLTAGLSKRTLSSRPLSVGLVESTFPCTSPRQFLLDWASLLAPVMDYSPMRLGELTRVMVINGEEDELLAKGVRKEVEEVFRGHEGGRWEVIQEVGHWALVEDVQAVGKLLNEFFDGPGRG